jgi:hypothetical protein
MCDQLIIMGFTSSGRNASCKAGGVVLSRDFFIFSHKEAQKHKKSFCAFCAFCGYYLA